MSNVRCNMSNENVKSNYVEKKSDNRYRAYKFALDIIKLCRSFPEKRVYWVIGDQLLRSGKSIGANIIEAKASSSKKDFTRYYDIALKSANESKYWLCLLRDGELDEIDSEKIGLLINEVDEICRMLGKSLITLKNK